MSRAIWSTAVLAALILAHQARADDVVYDSIPSPLPTNLPSDGYEATSAAEFGDAVTLGGSVRNVTTVTVGLSDWALASTYAAQIAAATPGSDGVVYTATGFTMPMTMNLYNTGPVNPLNNPGGQPSVGALIATQTIQATIAWRPEATAGCGSGFAIGNGPCYNGLAQTVTFNFGGMLVPDSLVWGLAFNTTDHGYAPTGIPGAYDSLNIALNDITGPSVGTDIDPDSVEWNTSYAGFLTNPGPGQTNVFGPDTGWTPYVPAVTISAVPEPASMTLLGAGLLGLAAARRKRCG